ncbi:SusC/RagA family TonB-linked outer membrane protein [Bacteroides stercoris]|jgi:TonB-linked SusC/RagA family outer membrane protein|uniref:TonB-dependent receptor n=1 Tax=Bacteroides stercoris TaxID=46506 RepID=A0A412DQR5_BACSE|nr:TonB-dependent receptor [Bacteroides stercoris]MDC2314347.1 TonB-dependent receptor [Bacteroides stercoris]MDC2317477.1 TonB-dependent receptor [Bacteroides stercoris]MDC2320565.1 TonB-dependent receptor [Bacteroides stercoris]MDC2323761.1 TonB-dependent receptor [Bacteroides stercoris]MDC2326914.1 TonB-dependent receptor [Bacteroides stercoris]
MRKSILWFVLLTLFEIPYVLAQNGFRVTGQIISADDNQPVIGVSIIEKGTTNGVITDVDGNYSIMVTKSPASLQFSYIGMKTVEKEFTAATRFDLKMESSAEMVDEVVVVAYGVRKKGTTTGSMSVVKDKIMETVPTPSFDQALQGQASGLQVLSNSGEPGAVANFKIRGINSINAGTEPLFILDGVAVSSEDFSAINPSDIESVSVLKDASSTSIYGARAANGVIVITTKRGRVGDNGKISVRAQYGVSSLAYGKWDVMNTTERLNYEEEIGLRKAGSYDRELLERTNIDWRDVVYNDAASFYSTEIQTSGATQGGFNYFISGNIFSQDGIAVGSSYDRYTFRANLEAKINNWFKVGSNATFAYEKISEAQEGEYTTSTPISASRLMLPYWNPYKEDGSWASAADGSWTGSNVNPMEWQTTNWNDTNKWKVIATAFAELRPLPGLTLRTLGGIDFLDMRSNNETSPDFVGNQGEGAIGRGFSRATNLTWTNTISYLFDIKDDHHFNVLLGQEAVDNQSDAFSVIGRGQTNSYLVNLSAATRADIPTDSRSGSTYLSFFSRAEYNYLGKYFVDLSARRDASSRFGTNSRWANFWSVGTMWNAKAESFLKNVSWLDNAQLLASIGTSGNSSIPDYDHLALVAGGPIYGLEGQVLPGLAPYSKGNEDLTWEKTTILNITMKLGFLNRFNLTAEFYNKYTSDMLMAVPVSVVGGYSTRWSNMGAMVNRGVDLDLNVNVLKFKDFLWTVSANASYNKNEIKELYEGRDEYELSTTGLFLKKGHSFGEFYTNRFAGVNPANGDALWYDKNGNLTNECLDEDKVLVGKSYIAPWQGGFGTSLSWKGLTVSTQFSWVADRWMMNNDRYFNESNGTFVNYNQSKKMLYDRWKKPGDVATVPRYGIAAQLDSRFLEDASFLRWKNLMVSYTLPANLLAPLKVVENIRVYAQGQNLLTFTKFQGMDPESSMNIYAAQYPMSRQFSIGLEIGF